MKSRLLSAMRWIVPIALVAGLGIGGYVTRNRWLSSSASETVDPQAGGHDQAGHAGHDHADGGDANEVMLSEKARNNLGLRTGAVQLTDYWKTLQVPGSIVERPGHSHRKVTAPLTGIVKELLVHPNQLVRPGDPVAELELTGDALAIAQTDLLATIRELELNQRELDRIEPLVLAGSLPEKNKLQLIYERNRLESQRATKAQSLEVLGLSTQQVQSIAASGRLLREFKINVPGFSSEEKTHIPDSTTQNVVHKEGRLPPVAPREEDWSYTVESIDVYPGKRVQIGDELTSLAFHATLYVEGQAFEKESNLIGDAMVQQSPVRAQFETGRAQPVVVGNLRILLLDNVVDPVSRTFHFFLPLANEVLHDSKGAQGETYRSWKFRPGQKVTLDVPIEKLSEVFVLPEEAVVREGPEAYVFRANGTKMERLNVEVSYAGGGNIVLKNDGSIFPDDVVALNNAYQLNLALKKASGSGIDPHAGHNH